MKNIEIALHSHDQWHENRETNYVRIDKDGTETEFVEVSSLMKGTIELAGTSLEFDKYLVTGRGSKKRDDFIVIHESNTPPITESFARLNRAATVGPRQDRLYRYEGEANSKDRENGEPTHRIRGTNTLPLSVATIAEQNPAMATDEEGSGIRWMRIGTALNHGIDVFITNPEHPGYFNNGNAIFIAVPTAQARDQQARHPKWDKADAFLSDSDAPLGTMLGSIGLRLALTKLTPDTRNGLLVPEL